MRDAVPNNLPAALTSFIGREREIAEIRRLLGGARLLTLTGAGGCGKSRLAFEVATRELGRFHDGVWLVELAVLADSGLVPQTTTSALRLDEQPGHALIDTLVESLRPKSLLLVLDNCEHLLVACADLAGSLLRSCPDLRIMATSREGLGVPGEAIWRVPSLSLPDLSTRPSPDLPRQSEAVRLFVERAAASQPGFAVTADNVRAVVQVCHRLDGIPLAIELAASRVRALAPEQIAARLDDRFALLTGGSRTGLPRHRTLRAAMDWSYDLLTEREQALLARLSVFAGGWTLEAAEAVCSGDGLDAAEILDLLTSLVDKSLVLVEIQGKEARYRLLETVRQYARERLSETVEAEAGRRRHRDWYLGLAERADLAIRGPEQAMWVDRLEAEHDNLRAAMEWSLTDERGVEGGSRLAWALMWFWLLRGHINEGREWLEKMVPRGSGVSPAVRARVLCGAGALSEKLGDYAHARARLDESLAIFRQLGDAWGTGFARHFLGHIARAQGNFAEAAHTFERSLELFRGTGDKWGCAFTLDCWGGTLISQGDYERATPVYEESVALFKEIGDKWELPGPLSGLGMAAAARGDYGNATALLEESLALARERAPDYGGTAMLRLGRVVFRQGDYERAAELFTGSLVVRRKRGDKDGIAACLTALAGVAVEQSRLVHAARLFGAAEALREAIHTAPSPVQRADDDRHLEMLRMSLDETALAAAWGEGRAMGMDEAIEVALASRDAPPPASGGTAAGDAQVEILTPREREVAALIAQGLTNREIAARLVVAERTAEGHVQNVLNKLGFSSRSQIAAWAVEHGIRGTYQA